MSELEDLVKTHARVTRGTFAKDGELYAPLWLIENMHGSRMLVATPFAGPNDKARVADVMRKTIREYGGVRYAYAVEAWFTSHDVGEDITVRPSLSPDRREAIFISGEDINGEQRIVSYEIKRNADGKPSLGPANPSAEFSGMFADMFAVGEYR